MENGNQVQLYYHQDLRGTVDYLTSPVSQKIESWTHYNEWGEITHNAVLKCGQRQLDLVKNYTGHEYDAVLNLYFAKARFYDAENRRFISMDPVKGSVKDPLSMVQYLYVRNRPLTHIDPLGEYLIQMNAETTPVTYDAILENTTEAILEYGITSFIPLGEWFVAIYQEDKGIVGGNGKYDGPEGLVDVLKEIDTLIGIENILNGTSNLFDGEEIGKDSWPSVLEAIENGFERLTVRLKGNPSGTKLASSLKIATASARGILSYIDIFSKVYKGVQTGNRLAKDQVLFDLINKVALDDSKYKNYLTGWTNPDKLEDMMDAALDYITASLNSPIYNLKDSGGPNRNITNYFYFFACITSIERYKSGNSRHPDWSDMVANQNLPKSLWDADRQVLYLGRQEYTERTNQYIAEYKKILDPNYKPQFDVIVPQSNSVTIGEFESLLQYNNARERLLHYLDGFKGVLDRHPKV